MTPSRPDLAQLRLGDVVTLSAGQAMSVRALERNLAVPVGQVAGFALVGEVGPNCALLSFPQTTGDYTGIFTPTDHVPPYARDAVVACQGVVSYLAPHSQNALGELGYKVARIRGANAPLVLLWRGEERVVFVHTGEIATASLAVTHLPLSGHHTGPSTQYAATVHPGIAPVEAPSWLMPAEQPLRRARRLSLR